MKRRPVLVLALVLSAGAPGAGSASGLAEEQEINHGLLVLAIADEIRSECDDVAARFFRAYSHISRLRAKARERGYSRDEVEDYLDDEEAEDRMRARRNAYFEANGASHRDPDSLCALGRAEIDRNSEVGYLLRAR